MKSWWPVSSTLLVVSALLSTASADIIQLKNGEKYSGSISRQGDLMVIHTDDGKTISARPDQIAGVTLVDDLSPDDRAHAEWTRLTQQIKAATDLQAILDLHESFLAKFPDAALAANVRSSREVYQNLAKNRGVKFRGRWMPAAQVEVVIRQWADGAKPAIDLYKAGKLHEAIDAARLALVADDQNPDALTVAGLAAYRAGIFSLAKNYFASLAAADPSSVLAENNLAVVCHQQRLMGEEIAHYVKAIQIAPDNRFLLDNIVESINAYTGDKANSNYRALLRQFDPAEKKMEDLMATKPKGELHRWGSSWVKQDDLDKLIKNKSDVQDQLGQLPAQFKNTQDTLNVLDQQIAQANADYDNAVQNVNYFNQVLSTPQHPLDVATYVAQRDAALRAMDLAARAKTQLQTQRDQLLMGAKDFAGMVDRVKGNLAAANSEFTGVQHIMDLGDDRNPPPPLAVAIPAPLPPPPPVTNIVINQAPPPPAIVIPVGIGIPVFMPGGSGPGNGGNGGDDDGGRGRRGRGGRGGPGTQPSTQPAGGVGR